MTTSTLMSLPLDIPWRRLATSRDMVDTELGDRAYPPRWRSSVSLFSYEPPADEQTVEDRIVTYVKVSCTITGFQAENRPEIRTPPEELLEHDWAKSFWHHYQDVCGAYHPCYGALLQVTVFPKGAPGEQVPVEQYPVILDFEPKKREMYESATESQQFASTSRSSVNVRKGTTTVEREESGWNIGAFLGWAAGAGGGLNLGVNGGYNAKEGTSTETVDMTTADYSREKRENYSYTTNLSHMHHLLDSYHLGTNRAIFFIQPRPHIIDTEYTFVNGPRRLEGIQEFFLIVERPRSVPDLCVEATLETAHLETKTSWWPRVVPEAVVSLGDNGQRTSTALALTDSQKGELGVWLDRFVEGWWIPIPAQGEFAKYVRNDQQSWRVLLVDPSGTRVCLRRGWNDLSLTERRAAEDWITNGAKPQNVDSRCLQWSPGGIAWNPPPSLQGTAVPTPPPPEPWMTGYWWDEDMPNDLLVLATEVLGRNPDVKLQNARVVWERVETHTGWLFVTGRTTSSCPTGPVYVAGFDLPEGFLVYEGKLDVPVSMTDLNGKSIDRIAAANRFGQIVGKQIVGSFNPTDRLPYGRVRVNDAVFLQERLAEALEQMPDDDSYNVPLEQIDDLDPELRRRLGDTFGLRTRKEASRLSLAELCVGLGLDGVEARRLRGRLLGAGPTPRAPLRPRRVSVPHVEGMPLAVARRAIAAAGLTTDADVVYQDALDSHDVVLGQYPTAGAGVSASQPVSLVVSSGPVVVPDVVGLSAGEAEARLGALGLQVERSVVGTDRPVGQVLASTPAANVSAQRHSTITLLIAGAGKPSRRRTG